MKMDTRRLVYLRALTGISEPGEHEAQQPRGGAICEKLAARLTGGMPHR